MKIVCPRCAFYSGANIPQDERIFRNVYGLDRMYCLPCASSLNEYIKKVGITKVRNSERTIYMRSIKENEKYGKKVKK